MIRDPSDVWTLGDAVVPVQTYVNDTRFGFTPDDLKDIYPAMLDMARDPKDKTLISFPLGGEGVVLVYNADRLATKTILRRPPRGRYSKKSVKRPRAIRPATAA